MDLSWLFGKPEFTPAPNRPYPTMDDVEFARKYGDLQQVTTPRTFQIANEQLAPDAQTLDIRSMAEANELDPATDQDILDTLARSALANRRSAIASLGANNAEDNVVGATDFMFDGFSGKTMSQPKHPLFTFFDTAPSATPSTPTHEAAHRGMFKLVDEINNMPDNEEYLDLRNYIDDPQKQEYAVRALMADKYDNPEADRMPDLYKQFFENPNWQYELDRARKMNDLAEALAAKIIQQRTPSGPR